MQDEPGSSFLCKISVGNVEGTIFVIFACRRSAVKISRFSLGRPESGLQGEVMAQFRRLLTDVYILDGVMKCMTDAEDPYTLGALQMGMIRYDVVAYKATKPGFSF